MGHRACRPRLEAEDTVAERVIEYVAGFSLVILGVVIGVVFHSTPAVVCPALMGMFFIGRAGK